MPSVLGKRMRQTLNAQENIPSTPSKRRQTRRAAPQIYEDTAEPEQVSTRRSVRDGTETTKCIVQDLKEQNEAAADDLVSPPISEHARKENVPPSSSTPTALRFKDALARSLPSTPRHRVRLGGKLLTPRSQRSVEKNRPYSVYAAARQLFTQASSPTRIIGRDEERAQLQSFISAGVKTGKGGCLYVSGPPGTGKSALVQEVFEGFRETDGLKISIVNCVTCRTTSEVTSQLSQDLGVPLDNGKTVKDAMGKLFTSKKSKSLYLVLMDEIDSLLDGDCNLLYDMFELAMHRSSSLLLIGIANALDLTDRFMPRLKSRNLKPSLLPFLPYAASDMSNIITQKLRSLLDTQFEVVPNFVPVIHPTAIKLIGSKIAAQTGDLRKAFNLARRTIDQIEKEALQQSADQGVGTPTKEPLGELSNVSHNVVATPPSSSPLKPDTPAITRLTAETAPQASIKHVAKLASSIFNNGTVSRLGGLNLQQKAVLCSLVAAERRQDSRDPFKTPSKSSKKVPSVKDLFEKYGRLCQRDDGLLPVLKNTEFRDVVTSLETLGLAHEAFGRSSSMLTPGKTPARTGRSIDERQFVSAVSESEVRQSLMGPGAELLQRLLNE
ncbi:uncharacterized protein HMPREF1541_06669 [Cyphellophora europaea CBS 101466]|uniref:Cell division control protein n=1 Tax=Cyphellophora europaea (strain CBS 101466) TaxID=1220924 RepID=W2RQ78_CYPE1|nr:uncharacterized protein HMPREF1541_06669 [Cyphellophora europaea CBS 101466]ETN38632.1 hypothetical protein HMPREF1541_06669 [Cyphellophora europaea CBS 101466]